MATSSTSCNEKNKVEERSCTHRTQQETTYILTYTLCMHTTHASTIYIN